MSEPVDLTICKADPTGTETVPDTHIHITAKLPESVARADWLSHLAAFYNEEARQLEEALRRVLPGGTYDRLLGRMLERHASLYRIPYQIEETRPETED